MLEALQDTRKYLYGFWTNKFCEQFFEQYFEVYIKSFEDTNAIVRWLEIEKKLIKFMEWRSQNLPKKVET